MLLLIWTAVVLLTLIFYLQSVYSKFSSRGVKTLRALPILGNMYEILIGRKHFVDDLKEIYFKFPDERFVGRYEFLSPIVIVQDLDLIKKIVIKDFEYFTDHRQIIDEKTEPMFGRNLFSLKGQEWKDMRSTLSPAFTSSKIKLMVPFMDEVGKQMLKVLEKKIEASGGYMDLDVKDLTTRYANDVIASCAFGLKVDSHTDENNIFYKMGKNIASIKFKQLFIFIFNASFPAILKRLNLTVFTETTRKFFYNLVLETMGEREAKNIVRPDMINILMQIKKGHLSHENFGNADIANGEGFLATEESSIGNNNHAKSWSDSDLVAQAVLFFIAGFETVSTAMSFSLHEIAMHPEIQERLYQEIMEYDRKNNGKIDYNSINNMPYLDMVVCESMRLWSPVTMLDRLCIKDYNMGKPHESASSDYIIRKGELLSIPIWAIHRDPKYFPDPEKFDPERFSEENKHNIAPFTYMPFGYGPRNCIGSRFAMCEVKMLLYYILLQMEVSPSEKLLRPVTLTKGSFTPSINGGHWVKFKSRK